MLSTSPFPALGQALLSQLKPAQPAGEALHAVSTFTGPAGAVAGGTPVAVLIGVVALGAVLHAGRVCQGRKRVCLGTKYDTCLPNLDLLPWWGGGAEGMRQCSRGLMDLLGAKMNVQEIESTVSPLGVEEKQVRVDWLFWAGQKPWSVNVS